MLCAKPRNFNQIRAERKKAEKEGTNIVPPPTVEPEEDEPDDGKVLDGFFLVRHTCIYFRARTNILDKKYMPIIWSRPNENLFQTDETLLC